MRSRGSSFRLVVEYRRRTDSGQLWVLGKYEGQIPARGQRLTVEASNATTGTVSSVGGVVSSLPNAAGIVLDGLNEDDVPPGSILIASDG
jgi:hypothetical protein